MHKTLHFRQRAGQRGMSKAMIDLALELGEIQGDRYVLNNNILDLEIERTKRRQKQLEHAKKKGGIVVAVDDDCLITTFRANSFCRPSLKNVRH